MGSLLELPEDKDHGLGRNQYENDRYIRCPYGCERIWDKAVSSFQEFYWHMEEVHS